MNEALVLLVLIWAVLLVPSALRSRRASPHATVGGFERAMNVLRTGPGTREGSRELLVPGDPGRIVDREVVGTSADGGFATSDGRSLDATYHAERLEDPMIARRRVRFVRLLIATTATLLLAVLAGSWLWLAFAATLGGTVGYTVLLRRIKLQRDEARQVVAELDLDREQHVAAPEAVVGGGWESGTVRLRRWGD